NGFGFAFPDTGLNGGLAFVVELDGVEVLEAPVKQLETGFGAGGIAFCADEYGNDTTAVTQCGGDQAVTGRRGVTRFQAVDGGVGPQQAVAVGLTNFVV